MLVCLMTIKTDCLKKEETPTQNTNCPDNNTFECATPIQLGVAKQDNISSNDDEDMFQVNLPSDGVIEVSVTNVPSNINLYVKVYDSNQWGLVTSNSTGVGESAYLYKVTKAGTHYVLIYDRDQNASNSNSYTILVTEDVSDSYEYNNESSNAKLVAQNTNLKAKFRPNDDVDWYQFTIPQDGVIDVFVTSVPATVNVYSKLYDANKIGIIVSYNNGLGQDILLSAVRKSALHYLEIYDQDHNGSSTNYYNFAVHLDVSDIYEYNNDRQTAKSINFNTNYQGKIRPSNDEDYFQFVLTSTSNITVNVSSVPSNIDMDVYVRNSNGTTIKSSTSTGNGQPVYLTVNNLSAGTYYLHLEDGNNDASSTSYYTFVINK